jgi:nucleoside-diphosphate-sugar epimerase
MNVLIPEAPKPSRIALVWHPAVGFYVLATDNVRRSFVDPDDAVAAIRLAIDARLDDRPRGNC